MGNPDRFERRYAEAARALGELAREQGFEEAARPSRLPDLPLPDFPDSGFVEPERKKADPPLAVPDFGQAQGGSLHLVKNALNGGEVSPELGCRFDQQRAAMGCHELLNMVPLPWGGISKRPGMDFVAESAAPAPEAVTRLLPFIFSEDQSRLLELRRARRIRRI